MKTFLTVLTILSAAVAPRAMAFELEGVYRITERDACDADKIDTLVIFTDEQNQPQIMFSSSEFTIVYQVYDLIFDGERSLRGVTGPASYNAATFTAAVSADGSRIEGKVDALACELPWHFVAELEPRYEEPLLSPLNFTPDFSTFVGRFSASTSSQNGWLKIMRLGYGPVVANFGNDLVPRIVSFETSRLDTEENALELFAFDEGRVQLKWKLQYGLVEGVLTLQGYGISAWGRYYAVNLQRVN